MKNYFNILLIAVLLTLLGGVLQAQESIWYSSAAAMYRRATDLYQNKEYGAASKLFRKYLIKFPDASLDKKESVDYYVAMSSAFLKTPFALQQLSYFASEYPESCYLPVINFAMGNLLFDKHKYTQALQIFDKVSPSNLTQEERAEYFFKKGFAYLKKNQPDNALSSFEKSMNYKGKFGAASAFYYAHIQYQNGDFDKALKSFKIVENNRKFKKLIPPYYMHIFYEKGDYDRVITEGEKFYRFAGRKNKSDLARIIANAYYEKDNFNKALGYFVEYERTTHQHISADEQYRIAYCKFKNKQYKAAIPNFQRAISGETQMAQNAWYYIGFCYRNTGENRFAQKAFLSAYKLKNNAKITADALFAYAKITIEEKGDPYNDAITTLQKYIATNPPVDNLNRSYDLLVQLYLSSHNNKAALQSIEKTKHPNHILRSIYQQLSYAQGVELYGRNDFKGAIDYFSASMKYPVDYQLTAKAIFWKGDAFYRIKQYPQAAEYYNRFLKSKKASSTGLIKRAYYNLAYTSFNLKKYDKAVYAFKKVLSFSNLPVRIINDVQLRLADSYFMIKHFDEALKWYDKASLHGRIDSDYALYQKSFCYAAKENYNKKIVVLQQLTSRYLHSAYYDKALYEIATTYSALNNQRDAIVYFNKIVKERPHSPFAKKALIKMGLVYYKNNQYDRAIATLKKVVHNYPASHEATIALNTLESIYKDKGELEKYFTYAKTLNFVQVSKSEEDSVTFSMGEEQFLEHDCSKAINSLNRYLRDFPDGGFVLKANYYLAKCYQKIDDTIAAMQHFQKILDFPFNDYTIHALLATARIAYNKKDFEKSGESYQQLIENAENKSTILEAEDGAMRSAFMLNNFKDADKYARMLLKTPKVNDDQIVYAHYILGKLAMRQNNNKEAIREFNITDNLTTGKLGAESKYYLAKLAFDNGNDKKAENLVYKLSEQYPDFEYWVAKGFILLSDIYVVRKNYFQARETLKSILQNYSGENLKKIARNKLALIPKESDKKNVNGINH